jgi:hypothetical protein
VSADVQTSSGAQTITITIIITIIIIIVIIIIISSIIIIISSASSSSSSSSSVSFANLGFRAFCGHTETCLQVGCRDWCWQTIIIIIIIIIWANLDTVMKANQNTEPVLVLRVSVKAIRTQNPCWF